MSDKLSKEEVAAMWLFHNEYADLGLSAQDYWKGLSGSNRELVRKMLWEISAAQQEKE